MLEIKGFQKTTLVDYPDKVACTIFLPRCDFRCGFCHNRDLVLNYKSLATISEKEILDYLHEKRDWFDGVVVSGGEPLLHRELGRFLLKVKQMGYSVKIDTNGTNPDFLQELIDKKLVDFIAMDIKNSLDRYEETAGIKVDADKIKSSIDIIKKSGVDYEFRTTVVRGLHETKELKQIGELINGAKRFALQNFRPVKELIDPKYFGVRPFSLEELGGFKRLLENFCLTVEIRA